MITFLGGVALLIIGYFTYGKIIEKNFQIEPERKTPAEVLQDGYDFVPMPKWKNALIQLLNIAGTGPIFGPILGALYGPVAYIWIVVGCIFAGAVHDYMIGMISLRNNGAHLPELAEKYLGKSLRHIVNIFAMLLLMLVSTIFVITPAQLITGTLENRANISVAVGAVVIAIFVYYLISTVIPIDKAMGKVYPWFGGILILSTFATGVSLLVGGHNMIELTPATIQNMHPAGLAIFPGIFFTISCGAMSGFHATQSPMISRTSTSEKEGRFTFYGMMIAEGVIAMIWAAAAMALFNGQTLSELIAAGTPSVVVENVSIMLLGPVFGGMAITGVIVLPISSGLSGFRSLRNILADYIGVKQDNLRRILMITLPLFAISFILTRIEFGPLWRYFNWSNQVTAVIALFVATRYLYLKGRNYWHTLIPGTFMLYACIVYILSEPIGFNLGLNVISYLVGGAIAAATLALFQISGKRMKQGLSPDDLLINDQLPIAEIARRKGDLNKNIAAQS